MFGFGKKKQPQVRTRKVAKGPKRQKQKGARRHTGPYTPDQRRQAVEAFFKSGMSQLDFAATWGTSPASLNNWIQIYRELGPKGLESSSFSKDAKKRGRQGLPENVKHKITAVKDENPQFGTKSVTNFLFRFGGVKVSNGTVRKTLREANYPPATRTQKKRRSKRKPKIQRFERATAMQLWQTDITSLMLTRHSQRVYLTVFMDDHSRYIVSWSLALQQTKEFVMEALLAGISQYGKPEEVLTDQGRQYFSWRGKSDFRKLLRKQGIGHVVARAHHPETVGKCERFWETVQMEFWDRVEPQDLTDARERLAHFIAHYNHFRPHQGLEGMTPADRFFGAAADVRRAIEDTVSKNALRIALGEAPRSPVFLIGQIGETSVSLHGERGKLVLQTPDGLTKRLDYEDFGHRAKPAPTQTEQPLGDKKDEQATSEAGIPLGTGDPKAAPQAPQERQAPHAQDAGTSSQSTLGDGDSRAEETSARGVSYDHGVLAGEDHKARDGRTSQDAASEDVADVPAGDFGYGGRATDSTQTSHTEEGQEHGNSTTNSQGPPERSSSTEEEDREVREDRGDAGAVNLGSSGDAGLQRCQNPHGDTNDGVSGSNDTECKPEQENDESGTDRSSS